MIYRKNGRWALCPKKVTYEKDGETCEEYTNKPEWYENFAKKWGNFEVLSIEDTKFSNSEIDRLDKVKNMSEGHREAVIEYIQTGEFPEGEDMAKLLKEGKITNNIIPEEYRDDELEQ